MLTALVGTWLGNYKLPSRCQPTPYSLQQRNHLQLNKLTTTHSPQRTAHKTFGQGDGATLAMESILVSIVMMCVPAQIEETDS